MRLDQLYVQSTAGDSAAREELFQSLSGRFLTIAQRKIGNREDAEEVAQKALMTVAEKHRQVTIESSFAAWALKVLNNKIGDYYRATGRERERHGTVPDIERHPTNWTPNPRLEGKLLMCLRKISRVHIRMGRILNLFYQGYNTNEVCGKLDCTPNNSYKLLSKARALLKHCLEKGDIKQ